MPDMSGDPTESGSSSKLNRAVAITVVMLSVFTGITKVKDDNIVQAMQQAKADANDRWSQYEASRTKLHIAETAREEIGILGSRPGTAADEVTQAVARLNVRIDKYRKQAPGIQAKARREETRYDALNVHDDQFDMSDVLISIALSLAGVAALAAERWLLITAWAVATAGMVMGVAGFAGWNIHPDALATLLS